MPKTLPDHPNLEQLRKQAKELRKSAINGDTEAMKAINAIFPAS
ncbi:hypothetical protein [Amycolatopsis rubida]|uniref:Uncharacterized protein n=1 Tax=Amycolatopsis rubida TaxID=112413 RepID=A0A1I6AIJ7_9PSEU|nr:hypothetical protein [Amycolatopsis rubida]SFQ68475.1 hypothetical protein SAMN05421854_11948 [Amycolatopsis rubida]